jgi:uncharacterized membrane protein HdeD (DUF308 family)
MKLLKKLFSRKVVSILGCLFVLTMPGYAMADSWVDVFESGSKTLNALKSLIVVAAYLVGTGLAVLGLWLIYKDGKEENRGHMKNGIISLVIGSLLLIFPTTIGWTVGTLGADNSAMQDDFNTSF